MGAFEICFYRLSHFIYKTMELKRKVCDAFFIRRKSSSYSRHMFRSGLALWEKMFPSREWSKILKLMIARNCFTPLKLKIGSRLFERCNFDFRNLGVFW